MLRFLPDDIREAMMIKKFAFTIVSFLISHQLAFAGLCPKWGPPQEIGVLPSANIHEASGLAISRVHPKRLYHINDGPDKSGVIPYLYITDYSGDKLQKKKLIGFRNVDPEALAYGSCPDGGHCLIIGDIGDNAENKVRRNFLELYVIDEKSLTFDEVIAKNVVKIVYPNGEKYDAEALALHPSGDIYLMTKNINFEEQKIDPARLYRLPKKEWQRYDGAVHTLEFVGEINFSDINGGSEGASQLVTGMDISEDGKNILFITYKHAFEFNFEHLLSEFQKSKSHPENLYMRRDYNSISIKQLRQQEAISYIPTRAGVNGFIYDTELWGLAAPIIALECK